MEEKLYDYMDWAEIVAVVYSEENHPRDILGPRVTEVGVLIQAFFPGEPAQPYIRSATENRLKWSARMKQDFSLFCFRGKKSRPIL